MTSDWLQQVADVLREDFSDVPNLVDATRLVVRLLIAMILGGLLGYEREQVGKEAGLRTHMLVAVGAALFVLIPQQAGMTKGDLSRIIQGLVAGIGFLGAGAILKQSDKGQIKGLTTAAGIWLTAAVGVAAGLGREMSAILGTLLALVILGMLPRFERWIGGRTKSKDSPLLLPGTTDDAKNQDR